MTDKHDPDRTTAGESGDSLDAALAEAFGPDSGPPLAVGGSVLKALSTELSEVPRVQLRDPDSGVHSPIVRPGSEQMPRLHDPASRYQLLGEIARGGMGAVLKGRDVDLGRDVAVKVLLESHAGKTELLQRFVEEAQIAGQLQHPGVVPVYEMGQFADKRPYFTMKLVKGQTLAKLLAERAEPSQERTRFVGVFLQVCYTLGYAHARGVIHRDLKPANVMVGGFGEVQVMDWGLAKVLSQGGVADEEMASRERERPEDVSIIRTRRSEGSDVPGTSGTQTQAGSVMGTPAYMAPEQALGEVDRLDERADVFSLGAILCEVLTGKAPYVGESSAQVHRKAVRADLADAFERLDRSGADEELLALCKRCLAAEPGDRPRHAGVLADKVSAYLQGVQERLRQAELARAQAEVKVREERKRRRAQLALAGALACLLALGAGGGLYLQRQHELRHREQAQRDGEMRTAVENTLDKVSELQKQAHWLEAASLLEQTRSQLGEAAPADLLEIVERTLADVTLVGELEAVRLTRATWVEGKFDNARADREYAKVFAQHRLAREGEKAEAVAKRVRASEVKEPLLAALDDWAFSTQDSNRRAWLMAVARAADPHPWRDHLRDPAVWTDRMRLHALTAEVKGEDLSPQAASALGWELKSEQAVKLLSEVQRHHPADFWVNFTLGTRLCMAKQEEAVGYLRVAVALRPAASAVHTNLGNALSNQGKADEAISCFHKAIELDPRLAYAHIGLGGTLCDEKHDFDGAIACFRKAIELDPQLANAHYNLGNALLRKGDADGAIPCFREAIALDPTLAAIHTHLGISLSRKGRLDEAIACHREAIALDPKHAGARSNLGNVLQTKGKLEEAIACHRMAIELDPRYAMPHNNLGNALFQNGEVDEAIEWFHKAINLDPKYANPHLGLGTALFSKGRYAEARDASARALALFPDRDPLRAAASQQLRACERLLKLEKRLPRLLRGEDKPSSALECLDLVMVCQLKRNYAAAARFSTLAFDLQPKLAGDLVGAHRYNAACSAALAAEGKGKDADKLEKKDRQALRRQALTWLRTDLARWAKHAASEDAAQRQAAARALAHWQTDSDLAGLRDKQELNRLPAEERDACLGLWSDVANLLTKAKRASPRPREIRP